MRGRHQAALPDRDDGWVAQIGTALGALDAEQRTVIELVYAQGLTQRQVAGHLHLTGATVAHHVARGLQRLAAVLR